MDQLEHDKTDILSKRCIMTYEVYDDRTNEVVFSSEHKQDCINFMTNAASDDEKFLHYWLREK